MKKPFALLVLILGVFFFACSIVKAGDVPEIFEYIPLEWVGQHPVAMLGPQMHYFNIAQLRKDLALPDLTKPNAGAKKWELLRGLYTHGLNAYSVYYADEWGLDIAHISQELFCSAIWTRIVLGDFNNPKFRNYFLKSEFKKRETIESFTVYFKESEKSYFVLSSSVLLIGPDLQYIVRMIEQKKKPQQSAAQYPAIKEFFISSPEIFGAFIAASGDYEAFSKETDKNIKPFFQQLPPAIREAIQKKYNINENRVCRYGWDQLFLSFGQERNPDALYSYYHYASEKEAQANKETVEKTVISNKIVLKSVDTEGSFVIAKGIAKEKQIIANSLSKRDFYGFCRSDASHRL